MKGHKEPPQPQGILSKAATLKLPGLNYVGVSEDVVCNNMAYFWLALRTLAFLSFDVNEQAKRLTFRRGSDVGQEYIQIQGSLSSKYRRKFPLKKPEQYDLLLLKQARIAQRAMNKQPQTPARAIRVPPVAPPLERQES